MNDVSGDSTKLVYARYQSMVYLSNDDLCRLDKWVYRVKGVTVCDATMRRWWNIAFRLVPLNTSPDTITAIGFISGLVCALLCLFYTPTLTEEVPRWVYACCSFGLFFYQTMDALDGKQCRRSGRSSGVEELYDHGCDSVNSILQYIATTTCFRLGQDSQMWVLFLFVGNFTFFSVHWRTYATGITHVGKFDHTEVQLMGMLSMLLTAFVGPSFWDNQIYQFTLVEIAIYGTVLTGGLKILENIGTALSSNKSIIPGSTMIFGHICFAISFNAIQSWIDSTGMLVVFGLFIGFFVAKQDQRMVVDHMVDRKATFFDTSLLPVVIFTFISLFSPLGYYTGVALTACCISSMIDMLHYFIGVTTEIADHYGFEIFHLRDTDRHFWDNIEEDAPDPHNKPVHAVANTNGHLKST